MTVITKPFSSSTRAPSFSTFNTVAFFACSATFTFTLLPTESVVKSTALSFTCGAFGLRVAWFEFGLRAGRFCCAFFAANSALRFSANLAFASANCCAA